MTPTERKREYLTGCKCDFRQYVLGDGCETCNPAKALEYAKETIAEQAYELSALRQFVDDFIRCYDSPTLRRFRERTLRERASELRHDD